MQKRTHNPVSTVPQKMSENCLLHNNAQGKLCKKKNHFTVEVHRPSCSINKRVENTHIYQMRLFLFFIILLPRVLQM